MLTISEIQDHLYIMLKEFDSFCKENDIKYSLSGGSLGIKVLFLGMMI